MAFRLILCTKLPGKKVLTEEKAISGTALFTIATECLRKTISDSSKLTHRTFGALDKYIINIPAQIAFASEKYSDNNDFYLIVPEGYLNGFIFYIASETSAQRNCYPFTYQDAITLTSRIDEIRVIQEWVDAGYPQDIDTNISTDPDDGGNTVCPIHPDCSIVDRIDEIPGCTVTDISQCPPTKNPVLNIDTRLNVMDIAKGSYKYK